MLFQRGNNVTTASAEFSNYA